MVCDMNLTDTTQTRSDMTCYPGLVDNILYSVVQYVTSSSKQVLKDNIGILSRIDVEYKPLGKLFVNG